MKNKSLLGKVAWQIGPAALFFLLVILVFPIWQSFQIDADEGVNLGKAMLVEQGFELYNEIWSDQPPVLTYLLAGVIRLFGYSVPFSRLLIVAFASLLLWAFFQILDKQLGRGFAISGTILLVLSNPFTRLSYAVMIGLPAISLATLSLYAIIRWHEKKRALWLLVSGAILGLAVMTKLFVGILALIIAIGLVFWEYDKTKANFDWRKLLGPVFLWGLGFTAVVSAIVLAWVGVENIVQLIAPHTDASNLEIYQDRDLVIASWLNILFVLGSYFVISEKRWMMLYPMGWAIVAFLFLRSHAPVWDHQSLLVTVPAIMVASLAAHRSLQIAGKVLKQMFFEDRNKLQGAINVMALAAVLLFIVEFRAPSYVEVIRVQSFPLDIEEKFGKSTTWILSALNERKAETQWLMTDSPMFAYRTGILTPPVTAAITNKRFLTGRISEAELIQTILEYRPEQVLLGRIEFPEVYEFLKDDYDLILYGDDKIRHYVLKNLNE